MAASAKSRPPGPRGKQPMSRAERQKKHVEDTQKLQEAVDAFDEKAEIKNFADLPLSEATAEGLRASHFQALTDVQARSIPLALKGRDVLGAAKTGSGKTLAFLIPILEKLHRARWTELDGLGALVISPTRELAVQIFEVLRKIGRRHPFSAGLVIGGKSLKEEAERVARMNILVCTPGRMLQHLDQTHGLDVDNLQMLVLDEADRIMDMGFRSAVDALVEHLPTDRQTLLFSATQSKKVSDLARLSLKDPEYVSVHEQAAAATPNTLQQHYVVSPLPEKIDALWAFIKANLTSKILVFLSSGKQVRFVYETFRQLHPGIGLVHLHGRQKQTARLEVTRKFTVREHICLLATDVVARGVDFPAVDWVVQVDCPEDTDTYIHRVGRTARYQSSGRAVLFLDPSEEEGMIRNLEQKKVPIRKINIKENKKKSIRKELQSMCFKNSDIKYLGQKAFISYARSVHVQKDKTVFKLDELDLDGFAAGLGLPGAPQIKYQKGGDAKKIKNTERALLSGGSDDSGPDEEGDGKGNPKAGKGKKKKKNVRTKYDRMLERTNQDVLSSHYAKLIGDHGDGAANDEEQDFFTSVKRRLPDDDENAGEAGEPGPSDAPAVRVVTVGNQQIVVDSKRREKMLRSKKKMLKFTSRPDKIVFDDDGNPRSAYQIRTEEDFRQTGDAEAQRRQFVDAEVSRVREADADDKQLARDKKRERKLKRKAREAAERGDVPRPAGPVVQQQQQDDGDEDPLALLRSLPFEGRDEDEGGDDGGEVEAQATKGSRKRAQGDSDVEVEPGTRPPKKRSKTGRRRVVKMDHAPEKLGDLEALATGLLDDY